MPRNNKNIEKFALEMDFHTRKHLNRALAAAKRAIRNQVSELRDLALGMKDDDRITPAVLMQTSSDIEAMKRTAWEIERMLALASLGRKVPEIVNCDILHNGEQ